MPIRSEIFSVMFYIISLYFPNIFYGNIPMAGMPCSNIQKVQSKSKSTKLRLYYLKLLDCNRKYFLPVALDSRHKFLESLVQLHVRSAFEII